MGESAADRRRFKRFETELVASIGLPDSALEPCMIRDYCDGGMLIEWRLEGTHSASTQFTKGDPFQLKTELQTAAGTRRIRLDGTIAWVNGDYLGLSFERSSGAIVSAFRYHDRHAATAAPSQEQDDVSRPQQNGEARCLAKLRHAAQSMIPEILHKLLQVTADDTLLAAEQGLAEFERQHIYADVNLIEKSDLEEELTREILASATPAITTGGNTRADVDEAPTIDPDDFERWLEASRVSNLLEQRFALQLGDLAERLSTLSADSASDASTVPFEPHHFTEALKQLAKQHDFTVTTRGILFERAATLLAQHLGPLYTLLDATLDGLGIARPSRDNKVALLRPADRHSDTQQPIEERVIQEGNTVPAPLPLPHVVAFENPLKLTPDEKQQLIARETALRAQLAAEFIDVVEQTDDLLVSLEPWIAPIRTLLRREARARHNFFFDSTHPLRRILDHLDHLQLFRRRSDLSLADDPLSLRVAESLNPINYDGIDFAGLSNIADAVARFTEEQSRLYQRNVERVVEQCESRYRVRRARTQVLAEINRRYANRLVPAVIPELLEAGWRAVLEVSLLEDSGQGETFRALLGTLDALIGLLGGDCFDTDAVRPRFNDVLDVIERQLMHAAFDPFRRNALLAGLCEELTRPGYHRANLVRLDPLDEADVTPNSAQAPAGVSESAWSSSIAQCRAVRVGDCLSFSDAAKDQQQLRVAWVRADGELLTLVDYRGLRVRDLPLFDLAMGLYRHRIRHRQISGQTLSTRAIDALLHKMELRLSHQTAHDSLTGLLNRQQLHAALAKSIALPGRSNDIGTLLWIDIDQFRLINDRYGYEIGDRLLVAVARLLESMHASKVLAHLGADRFAMLLADASVEDATRLANRICEAMHGLEVDADDRQVAINVAIGLVPFGEERHDAGAILRAADFALTQAKAAGGNQVHIFCADDPHTALRSTTVQWIVKVDDALDHGELKLRCQPIVPLRAESETQAHFEILLGVRSGTAESLPVAEFIEAAERYNKMRAVDRWVVRTTMEWMDRHRRHMPVLQGFAVNLSGQTANDPSFVDFVRQQFQRTRVDPRWLSFEITETAAVTDPDRIAGVMRELKAMGCNIALDDFGSGLASFSYLRQLPVDTLKIDGAIVRKIAGDPEDFAVVRTINEIGHFSGKKTVAEYVANAEILQLIRQTGVDFAQGYEISRPMLLDELLQPREDA